MYIPSVLDIPVIGAFTVVDIDTGSVLHRFDNTPDASGDITPEASLWPALEIAAENGRIIIKTRQPKPDPRKTLQQTRREYLAKQTAPYNPGTRCMY